MGTTLRESKTSRSEVAPQARGLSRALATGSVLWTAVAIVAGFLLIASLQAGSSIERFFLIGLQFVPLTVLAALAYNGSRNRGIAVVTYVWLALVVSALFLFETSSVFLVYLKDPYSGSLSGMFAPGIGEALALTLVLQGAVLTLSAPLLLRQVRAVFARYLVIDPDYFVHKIALFAVVLLSGSSFVPLVVLSGRPPLLQLVNSANLRSLGGASDLGIRPVDLVYQFVWIVPATLLAAGWLTTRNLRMVLSRLGLVKPSPGQVAAAAGLGVTFWAFSTFVLEPGISALWSALGMSATDVAAFGQFLGPLMTPVGAALIGITAGIGEEMAVRGLLQPRVGLVLSNLLFTSLHAFQYGFDALLSVFIVGLVLGIVRGRTNTTTSAVMHAVYNFTTVMVQVFLQ